MAVDLVDRIDAWCDSIADSHDPGFASLGRDLLYEVCRERDSLARRCAVRFEETETARAVTARLLAKWSPDTEGQAWWRSDGRTADPMTEAERAWLTSVGSAPHGTDLPDSEATGE